MKTSAVILMGGSGERFGSAVPKQFHSISGKKVYQHTLERLYKSRYFHEIILVVPKEWKEKVEEETKDFFGTAVILGGKSRQSSSYLGLLACKSSTEYVLVHDAVRPFVSIDILKRNISAVQLYGAVDTCIPSADTLVYAPNKEEIAGIPDRSHYLRGQTPQTFSYGLLKRAHEKAIHDNYENASDDCQLVVKLGEKVHVVMGEERNYKITTELDLFLAEQHFRLEQKIVSLSGDMSHLKDKVIVVTGGTGGIGLGLVNLLKEYGAVPIVVSRSSETYPADLRDAKDAKRVFETIFQKYGAIDGLVNSIGFLKVKELQALLPEEVEELIDVNLQALIYSCQYAKLKPGAHIVNIASSSYAKGRKDFAVYSSTKAAVVNFTQGLAEENPHLQVNAVVPQRTATKMRYENFPLEDQNELLPPEKVALTIVELLSNKEITGSIIEVRRN